MPASSSRGSRHETASSIQRQSVHQLVLPRSYSPVQETRKLAHCETASTEGLEPVDSLLQRLDI
jgi:hypothetical protein